MIRTIRKRRQEQEAAETKSLVRRKRVQYLFLVIGVLLACAFLVDVKELKQVDISTLNWRSMEETIVRRSATISTKAAEGVITGRESSLRAFDAPDRGPVAQSCTDLAASTTAYAKDVFRDAENVALKPWKSNNWEVPILDRKLLTDAFAGRKVVLVGDSTLGYTMHWIHQLLDATTDEMFTSLQNYNLTGGADMLTESYRKNNIPFDQVGGFYDQYDKAHVFWLGYRGGFMHLNCLFEKREWKNVVKVQPDIMLINWGAHILYNPRSKIKICNIYQWIHYEEWIQKALDVAEEAGAKVVLFKTTNRLCPGSHVDPQTVEECLDWVTKLGAHNQFDPQDMRSLTDAQKTQYCQEGLLQEDAAERLNARLRAYISKIQREQKYTAQIAIYDDHEMMSCGQTSDGLHYFNLQLPRIRLFAHMVHCMYPSKGLEDNKVAQPQKALEQPKLASAPNQDSIAQSCVDLTASASAFAQDVYNDAEANSLRPWTSSNSQWQIPTLDHDLLMSAFGGRTVVLLGDSTLGNNMNWIHKLMEGTKPELLSSLQSHSLTEGMEMVNKWTTERKVAHDANGGKYEAYKQAFVVWLGFRGYNLHANCQFYRPWNNIRKVKPQVMLANWGAHILFRSNKQIKLCNIHNWVHYERWLDSVIDVAEEVGVKVLLFKTTNRICDEKFRDVADTAQCQDWVANLQPRNGFDPDDMRNVSDADKAHYCNEGLLLGRDAERLNSRLKAYVANIQQHHPTTVKIAVYDDHEMTSCEPDNDGVHNSLHLPRIRLFAHMVNCLYPDESPQEAGVALHGRVLFPTPAVAPIPNEDAVQQTETLDSIPNQDAVAQYCAELTESTSAFAQDVFDDAEANSLKHWTSANERWQLPGLDTDLLMSAFGGRTVAIVGDSTTAYTMQWIHRLMNGTTPEFVLSLQNNTLSGAMQLLNSWHTKRNSRDANGWKYKYYNNAHIFWLGFRGISMSRNCYFEHHVWSKIRKKRPEVMLVNWGAHILFNERIKVCNIHQWIHYEKWLQGALKAALDAGVKVLLFKTTNRICKTTTLDSVQGCQDWVANLGLSDEEGHEGDPESMRDVSDADRDRYCHEGLLNEDGAAQLNARLSAFVARAQDEYVGKMRIAIYNNHDLESCAIAGDGVHHHLLQLPRIRLFAHMTQCLYTKQHV